MKTVNFTQMEDGTKEEYMRLRDLEHEHVRGAADRVLRELALQAEESSKACLPSSRHQSTDRFRLAS